MTDSVLLAAPATDDFDAPVRGAPQADIDALVVNLDGYEGPLDVLLDLARAQRVDLRKISMLALVDQYLAFVEAAKRRDLELAADYLVMAAWLAYLKSRLLLPHANEGPEPTADEMAAQLSFQLRRLEAMRKAAERLLALPRLGLNVFPRGMPEGVRVRRKADWRASLFDLLQAYTRQRVASVDRTYVPEPPRVWAIEEARLRLERVLGAIPDWVDLRSLAPAHEIDAPPASLVASAFGAALEFAKDGKLFIRQLAPFEPIYVRRRDNGERIAP
jgi:segregation and condensation protein A